ARTSAPHGDRHERQRFYVVVEKILARHETLRSDWEIAGTTGYDFISLVNGLFVDPAGESGCDLPYRAFVGDPGPFREILLAAKDTVIETLLAGELNVLANALERIAERDWSTRDYTMHRLRDALKAVVSHFPVYRTYVDDRRTSAEDRRDIDWAVGQARRSWRGADREVLDLVHDALTGDLAAAVKRSGAALRHAVPAIPRSDHGQSDGGHGLLSLSAPALAERGGWRSAPVRSVAGRVPSCQPAARARLAALDAGDRHPRHQAGRGCARAHRCPVGDAGGMAAARAALGRARPLPAAGGARGAPRARPRPRHGCTARVP